MGGEEEKMMSSCLQMGTQPMITVNHTLDGKDPSRAGVKTRGLEIDMNEIPKESRENLNLNEEEEEEEEDEEERGGECESNGAMKRKKLRLTTQQSASLEDSFKQHNTLCPKKKIELAKQLNLKPRQVEVWFQNRRARTKLKQTEIDYEYFKQCCETLTKENRKLQRELMELRALKRQPHFYMRVPATTLAVCPACERDACTSCERDTLFEIPTAVPFCTQIRSNHELPES